MGWRPGGDYQDAHENFFMVSAFWRVVRKVEAIVQIIKVRAGSVYIGVFIRKIAFTAGRVMLGATENSLCFQCLVQCLKLGGCTAILFLK